MPSVKPGTLTGRTTIISRDVATVGIEEAYAKIVTVWKAFGLRSIYVGRIESPLIRVMAYL